GLSQVVRVSLSAPQTFGSGGGFATAFAAIFRSNDQSRVIRQLPPQPLRAGDFRCPARVVQPCKAKVVQPRRSQPGSSKLAADHLAPTGEEAGNPRCSG